MKQTKKIFIELALNRFQDLLNENFLEIDSKTKLITLQNGFAIFDELVSEKRINFYFKKQSVKREEFEPMENIFNALRNYFVHFPIFNSFEECFIQKDFIKWNKVQKHSAIDNFFTNFANQSGLVFCFEAKEGISKSFETKFTPPIGYNEGKKVFLRDVLDDNSLNFIFLLMKGILEQEFPNFYTQT